MLCQLQRSLGRGILTWRPLDREHCSTLPERERCRRDNGEKVYREIRRLAVMSEIDQDLEPVPHHAVPGVQDQREGPSKRDCPRNTRNDHPHRLKEQEQDGGAQPSRITTDEANSAPETSRRHNRKNRNSNQAPHARSGLRDHRCHVDAPGAEETFENSNCRNPTGYPHRFPPRGSA